MNTVLYFQSPSKTSAPAEKLIGAREIAYKLNWHLQVFEMPPSNTKIGKLIDFWKPIGIIVECGEWAQALDARLFRCVPVVFIDRSPSSLPKNSFCIIHDSFDAGQIAARELMATGYTHFAFVPFPGKWEWNELRRKGFMKALKSNGFSCEDLDCSAMAIDSLAFQQALRKYIKSLPKPCAIFAANDRPAEAVIAETVFNGFSIPQDVAILGVDNYEPICDNVQPPLSSLKPDFRNGGRLAAFMLAAILRYGNNYRGDHIRKYKTIRVVRRASSRILPNQPDREVAAALELIVQESCNGLTAEQVMGTFSCSRQTAAAKFKRATGHTILEEIHLVRLEQVKAMISDPYQQLKTVCDFCGFSNPNALQRFFLRSTGMTMSAWRKEQTTSRPRKARR